jgi:hypothetical protein
VTIELVAIDPGTTHSGWVSLDGNGYVVRAGVLANEVLLEQLGQSLEEHRQTLAIEWVSSFGMPVGREVFETCRWVGRFQEAWHTPRDVVLITRAEVKRSLCNSARAKDPNVRQALIDLYPPTGGGSVPQIGTAKRRGPLYGVSSHAWSALAVAVVASGRFAKADGRAMPAFMPPIMGATPLERIA